MTASVGRLSQTAGRGGHIHHEKTLQSSHEVAIFASTRRKTEKERKKASNFVRWVSKTGICVANYIIAFLWGSNKIIWSLKVSSSELFNLIHGYNKNN